MKLGDDAMVINPSDRTRDTAQYSGKTSEHWSMTDEVDGKEMSKGGPVKKTGSAKIHKGEHVIKKSSAQKYGPAKMAAVNKGTAKVSVAKRGRR